jgi:hypothetical protein
MIAKAGDRFKLEVEGTVKYDVTDKHDWVVVEFQGAGSTNNLILNSNFAPTF